MRLVLPEDKGKLAEIKSKVYWAALMEPYSTFDVPQMGTLSKYLMRQSLAMSKDDSFLVNEVCVRAKTLQELVKLFTEDPEIFRKDDEQRLKLGWTLKYAGLVWHSTVLLAMTLSYSLESDISKNLTMTSFITRYRAFMQEIEELKLRNIYE